MPTRLILSFFIASVFLSSCTTEQLATPMCRVDSAVAQNISANAGCIIRVRNKMITVKHRLSGKLDIPGGTGDEMESAACTAHRETWEETGFNVEIKQLLGTSPSGFHFFECQLSGNFVGDIIDFPVPTSGTSEIEAIRLMDPFAIGERDWRFDNQLPKIRTMFSDIRRKRPDETD